MADEREYSSEFDRPQKPAAERILFHLLRMDEWNKMRFDDSEPDSIELPDDINKHEIIDFMTRNLLLVEGDDFSVLGYQDKPPFILSLTERSKVVFRMFEQANGSRDEFEAMYLGSQPDAVIPRRSTLYDMLSQNDQSLWDALKNYAIHARAGLLGDIEKCILEGANCETPTSGHEFQPEISHFDREGITAREFAQMLDSHNGNREVESAIDEGIRKRDKARHDKESGRVPYKVSELDFSQQRLWEVLLALEEKADRGEPTQDLEDELARTVARGGIDLDTIRVEEGNEDTARNFARFIRDERNSPGTLKAMELGERIARGQAQRPKHWDEPEEIEPEEPELPRETREIMDQLAIMVHEDVGDALKDEVARKLQDGIVKGTIDPDFEPTSGPHDGKSIVTLISLITNTNSRATGESLLSTVNMARAMRSAYEANTAKLMEVVEGMDEGPLDDQAAMQKLVKLADMDAVRAHATEIGADKGIMARISAAEEAIRNKG